MTLDEKVSRLTTILQHAAPLLVAYSGGVDSTCLLAMAHKTLGVQTLGVIADSPSLPRTALQKAMEVANQIGASVKIIKTSEFENEDYLKNPPNRCYFCKAELFQKMEMIAKEGGFPRIAYGENADDPADLRPGSRAAAEFHVLAPLKAAGLTKADVRALSRSLGLPTHDSPAQPCLSSRIPHGTRVTAGALMLVERAEAAMRTLGFKIFRVRFLDESPPAARVQIAPSELAAANHEAIRSCLQKTGFSRVEIDPGGYSGPVS